MTATPGTPMNRLIVLLLSLNLVCLALLLYRSFWETKPAPEANAAAITAAPAAAEELEPAVETRPAPPRPPAAPRPVQRQPAQVRPAVDQVAAAAPTPPPATTDALIPTSEPLPPLVNLPQRPAEQGTSPGAGAAAELPEVVGRVVLRGARPAEIRINLGPICSKYHQSPLTTRHYVVGEERGLGNVLVWLKGSIPWTDEMVHVQTPAISARGCLFEPYVLGVLARQKFQIKNEDEIMHNAHLTPRPGKNQEASFALMPYLGTQPLPGSRPIERVFRSPELSVRLKCDVHPWMMAYVHVMENPFFAITDTNGVFQLPTGFPAGRYTLGVYHVKTHGMNGGLTQEVDLRPGRQELNFEIYYP